MLSIDTEIYTYMYLYMYIHIYIKARWNDKRYIPVERRKKVLKKMFARPYIRERTKQIRSFIETEHPIEELWISGRTQRKWARTPQLSPSLKVFLWPLPLQLECLSKCKTKKYVHIYLTFQNFSLRSTIVYKNFDYIRSIELRSKVQNNESELEFERRGNRSFYVLKSWFKHFCLLSFELF